MESVALYVPDGATFVPTPATAGPWDPQSQHGGPSAALLADAIEHIDVPTPMPVTRLTYDLLRPVPMAPLTVRTEVIGAGRRVTRLHAALLADGVAVMGVTALCVRAAELDLPGGQSGEVSPGPPGVGTEAVLLGPGGAYNDLGIEIRFVKGGFQYPGPATAWTRLRLPVVAGERTTPLMRAAAAADLGNGLSSVLRQRDWLFVNPDLTIHLARPPAGEWIAMRSLTLPFGPGTGMAESAMFDDTGRFALAAQSLLIDAQPGDGRRAQPPPP